MSTAATENTFCPLFTTAANFVATKYTMPHNFSQTEPLTCSNNFRYSSAQPKYIVQVISQFVCIWDIVEIKFTACRCVYTERASID